MKIGNIKLSKHKKSIEIQTWNMKNSKMYLKDFHPYKETSIEHPDKL